MKLSEKLWCDLKTDSEKQNWLLMGRGYETGVVAHVIQTDLANTYIKIIHLTQERDTYRELCGELLNSIESFKSSCSYEDQLNKRFSLEEIIIKSKKLLGEKK